MNSAPLVYDLGDVCASLGGLNDRLVDILEAVRALKPAPDPIRKTANNVFHAMLKAEAEVERLQKVVADQALAIGTLKDTCARLREPPSALDEPNFVARRNLELEAELLRFRGREGYVRALVADCLDGDDSAYSSDDDHDNQARLARAVRDFRLEPAP